MSVDVVTVYRDKRGEWRWNRRDVSTGNIVADSGEGYANRADCEDQARQVNGYGVEYVAEDGALINGDPPAGWDNEPENQPDQ